MAVPGSPRASGHAPYGACEPPRFGLLNRVAEFGTQRVPRVQMSATPTDTSVAQRSQRTHVRPRRSERPTVSDLSRHIRLFHGLSESELSEIASNCEVRSIDARGQIAIDGELVRCVFFVLRGAGRLVALAPKGSGVTMIRFRGGDALGVAFAMAAQAYDHRAGRLVCDEATTLVTMTQQAFRELAEANPALCLASCLWVSELHVALNQRCYELTALDVRGRLLAELVRLSDPGESGPLVLKPAPTHAELGDQIGAAREAVSRHLLLLEREGIIESGRRRIIIKDLASLRRLHQISAGRSCR